MNKRALSQAHSDLKEQEEDILRRKAIRQTDGTVKFKKEKKKKKHHHREDKPDEDEVKQQEQDDIKNIRKRKLSKTEEKLKKEQAQEDCRNEKKEKKHSKKKKKDRQVEDATEVKMQDFEKQSEATIYQEDEQIMKIQREKKQKHLKKKSNKKKSQRSEYSKKQTLSIEDSDRIIYLFSLDAGDYKTLDKKLPHLGQTRVRAHIKRIFEWILEQICWRVKSSQKRLKQWQDFEKLDIIRQLHRIRSSNRLLSQTNVQFRQIFHKMMRSYNHPEEAPDDRQMNFLYLRIQAFVRGFNQIHFSRKNHCIPDQMDERRKPLIEGGYIMEDKAKRENRKLLCRYASSSIVDPDKLIEEWSQEEERVLSQLYLVNTTNSQYIIQNLKAKYGQNIKWQDFEILGAKLDHLIILGLDKLQELTNNIGNYYVKPKEVQEQKRQPAADLTDLTGMIFSNKKVCRTVRQGGIIKNPSLLVRQIFGHTQSYKLKQKIVKLLIKKYPDEEDVINAINEIKQFSEFANREEETNKVTMNRSRLPVLDDGSLSHSLYMYGGKSQISSIYDGDDLKESDLQVQNINKKQQNRHVTLRGYQAEEEPASFEQDYGEEQDYDQDI